MCISASDMKRLLVLCSPAVVLYSEDCSSKVFIGKIVAGERKALAKFACWFCEQSRGMRQNGYCSAHVAVW